MEIQSGLIAPVIALVAWSLVMWLWMYATRIPAIIKAKIRLDPNVPASELGKLLPPRVRWKADNYNHLMEQPTVFYAIVFALALIGEGSDTNIMLAWSYVALRVAHSVLQALVNKIEVRFFIFVLSNIPLFALTVNAIMAVM